MKKREKVLLTLLLVGVLGALAGLGVFGAFSATTSNPNNEFSSGTVSIADNDSGSALYNVSNQKPGDSVTSCIRVTYTGSLPANVHLYNADSIGTLGQYVDLTITPGTAPPGAFPSCASFTPDGAATPFTGTVASFAAAHNNYANGYSYNPGASWIQNEDAVFRFTVTLQSNAPFAAQGQSTGVHAYTWEAQNQ